MATFTSFKTNVLIRIDVARRLPFAAGNTVLSNYQIPQPGTSFSYELVSNPFLTGTESTMGWTRTKRDTVGRVVEVAHFSGSALPSPWGTNNSSTGAATTSYSVSGYPNCATATDEAGVSSQSCADGLGRMTSVTENGIGATTSYGYDVLDNLTSVIQGSTTRSFNYSSLKRLTSVMNPESGTVSYGYDAPSTCAAITLRCVNSGF